MERLRGELKRVRFASDDGQFAVCDLLVPDRVVPVTLVGNILATRPGESVEVWGRWREDVRYGRQFAIERIEAVLPATREGVERYLASDLIEGIGPTLARRIVAHFGASTLEILDAAPERVQEVEGIGKKRAARITASWEEGRLVHKIMVFLRSHGVSNANAVRIYRTFGAQAVEVIQQNPYALSEAIFGIGFKSADRIAMQAGVLPGDLSRLRAGLLHTLGEASGEGHMYLPWELLRPRAAELLGVGEHLLADALESLRQEERVSVEASPGGETRVYAAGALRVEERAARRLRRLAQSPGLTGRPEDAALAQVERELGVALAEAQRRAVRSVFEHKLAVITGGPGTGKTTIVRAICELAERQGWRVTLAAPTGRAARRLGETTARGATTVHRLLEYSFQAGGFQRDEERPLETDLLIVDEASMVDTWLLAALAAALPATACLALVGDIDQLPSVGPGQVLRDVIDSGIAGVTRLTEIFRQAEASTIVVNAHRINAGKMPVVPARKPGELVDFYTINAEDPKQAHARIVELVTERMPRAFGLDPLQDVQILAPMHRGEVGCSKLNEALQRAFHQGKPELVRGHRRFCEGDRVMQTRNNYEAEVFNGDVGQVVALHAEENTLTVRFDEREVSYDRANLDELVLAYAITVHKSQGSEYRAVVLPMSTQHYVMLQRNLLYTAVTRARELVVVVGSEEAVRLALKNDRASERYTQLARRLRGESV
ncbi:ATP-dependent RecD-like DNA helicase [Lujinxingia litoralis]|uniref:ATP-dependent RecD-like DNA helicase n=1 Tax=Lujinxingia litoralis TaxID=2211119 RepID=A0A328C2A4_9DELT|nr:ATP-dependent RecD-like DNA helicase [Lujinxingia litoralis]